MRRRTVVTQETERVLVIRSSGIPISAWCQACDRQVQMLTPDEAAALIRVSPRAIYRLMEARRVHFTETPGGRAFICLSSLQGSAGKPW